MKTIKFNVRLYLAIILVCAVGSSCRKDKELLREPVSSNGRTDSTASSGPIWKIRGFNEGARNEEPDHPMVLGERKGNPYQVDNMTAAWNHLYEPDIVRLPVTHWYVRFLPASLQAYKRLLETGINLYDFPLDYRIVEEGDDYHDPSLPADQITWQYAVVKPGFVFPAGIQHELLSELALAPKNSLLVREAYRLVNEPFPGKEEGLISEGAQIRGDAGDCTPQCPNYPCCLMEDIDCDDIPCNHQTSPPCTPDSPDWPACMIGNSGTQAQYTENSCGCEVYSAERKPGGCLQVTDTRLPANGNISVDGQMVSAHLDGVQHVKVILKDDFFSEDETWTDAKGCFRINKLYYGVAWMWVKFQSSRVTVRGLKSWKVSEYALPVKDFVGKLIGPNFHDIRVVYGHSTDTQTQALRYWMAATANNALYAFDGYAQEQGFLTPPDDLDILVSAFGNDGACPMFDDLFASGAGFSVIPTEYLEVIFNFIPPGINIPLLQMASVLSVWAPDVFIGYQFDERGLESDQIKSRMFHEFAHASHYRQAGNDVWKNDIHYFATQNGYGDGLAAGADLCSVIEMWGFHIGPSFADQVYGLYHSNVLSDNPPTLMRMRHYFLLERAKCFNNSNNFIPLGLLHDCMDDNAIENPDDVDWDLLIWGIKDEVKGFTNSQFYNCLTSDIQSPQAFKNRLRESYLSATPNTVEQYNTLFSGYGL